MTLAAFNTLRPGDMVIYQLAGMRTKGKVISVLPGEHAIIQWSDGARDKFYARADEMTNLRKGNNDNHHRR